MGKQEVPWSGRWTAKQFPKVGTKPRAEALRVLPSPTYIQGSTASTVFRKVDSAQDFRLKEYNMYGVSTDCSI